MMVFMDLLQIALDPARQTRKRTPQTLCENLGNQEVETMEEQ